MRGDLKIAGRIGNSWFYSPALNVLTVNGIEVPPLKDGWRSLDSWPGDLRDLERVWPAGYEFAEDDEESLYFRPKSDGGERQRAIDFLTRLESSS